MCTTSRRPAYLPVSGSSRESLGNSMVSVHDAATARRAVPSQRLESGSPFQPSEGSVGRPEGRSIEITSRQRVAFEFISLMASAALPRGSPHTPEPSTASITTVSGVNSDSGENRASGQTEPPPTCIMPSDTIRPAAGENFATPAGRRSRLERQSGDISSSGNDRSTETLRELPSLSCSSLTTARPSPALLPLPATIRYSGPEFPAVPQHPGFRRPQHPSGPEHPPGSQRAMISRVRASAALSIRARLSTGRCSIV